MAILPSAPNGGELNPDKVISRLFYFHSQAHLNHLQTRSYAEHKALDELYSGLEGFKDSISELLFGYIAPKRLGKFENIALRTDMSNDQLLNALCKFADDLYAYGEMTKWWALSNKAAELSELGYKVKYLLTLT
jgi:hypothetical protein